MDQLGRQGAGLSWLPNVGLEAFQLEYVAHVVRRLHAIVKVCGSSRNPTDVAEKLIAEFR